MQLPNCHRRSDGKIVYTESPKKIDKAAEDFHAQIKQALKEDGIDTFTTAEHLNYLIAVVQDITNITLLRLLQDWDELMREHERIRNELRS